MKSELFLIWFVTFVKYARCNEADAAAKIAVRGQLTSLCKACAKDSLAVAAVQDKVGCQQLLNIVLIVIIIII